MTLPRTFLPYLGFIALALALSWATRSVPFVGDFFAHVPEGLYLAIGLLLIVGYGLNYFAPKTVVPSFVWAILFGMALQPPLAILTENPGALLVVVELLAALVLFGGGVEVPFKSFSKYFAPIATISLVGTFVTILLFALSLEALQPFFGFAIPAVTLVLISAILASIDPTAIIPTLKELRLKKPFLRDIAIAESAVNDVAGTIFTRLVLVAALAGVTAASVVDRFAPFVSRDVLDALALEIIWGVLVGLFGAWLLRTWSASLTRAGKQWGDPALFFAVPIVMFALGSLVGGSGFLAAFVAGLLFDASEKTETVQHFFETFVDGFIKPVIFLLLGAIVPIVSLLSMTLFGLVAALVFMFAIRPFVVFLSLAPWMVAHAALFSWRELVFLSFIRETGAIPAILILVAVAAGVPASDELFALGMWVILATLLIEPPATPWLAKKLGVAYK